MSLAAAVVVLAVATAVLPGPPGSARLRVVTTPAAAGPTGRAGSAGPAVGPPAVVVGGAAAGALAWAVTGSGTGGLLVGAIGVGLGLVAQRRSGRPDRRDDDPADLVAAWTQLAACLEVGLPVAAAVTAAGEPLAGRTGADLRRVAGLLELGADPVQAWAAARDNPALATFARAAGRSAGTGAALARAARADGARLRSALLDAAEARAQRAAVLITAPLGLCFLPAFLVLGITPVVIGLAAHALSRW